MLTGSNLNPSFRLLLSSLPCPKPNTSQSFFFPLSCNNSSHGPRAEISTTAVLRFPIPPFSQLTSPFIYLNPPLSLNAATHTLIPPNGGKSRRYVLYPPPSLFPLLGGVSKEEKYPPSAPT